MEKIIRFFILIILILAAVKYGKPFLQQAMRGGSGSSVQIDGNSPAVECVNAAGHARDAFGETMRVLRPGGDGIELVSELDSAISEARSLCYCSGAACERASTALDILDDISSQVADPSQIGNAALQAARNLEQVNDLLDQAAAAAR